LVEVIGGALGVAVVVGGDGEDVFAKLHFQHDADGGEGGVDWARSPLASTWPFYSFPFYNFPDNMYAGVDANFCSGICQQTEGIRNFPNGSFRTI